MRLPVAGCGTPLAVPPAKVDHGKSTRRYSGPTENVAVGAAQPARHVPPAAGSVSDGALVFSVSTATVATPPGTSPRTEKDSPSNAEASMQPIHSPSAPPQLLASALLMLAA
jgi:hypothetical protein